MHLCAKPSCSPFAVEREGDASCVLVLYAQSVNPLFVLPPSFDSDLVEPLFAYRNLSCLIHLFSSVLRHMLNLVISVNGEYRANSYLAALKQHFEIEQFHKVDG